MERLTRTHSVSDEPAPDSQDCWESLRNGALFLQFDQGRRQQLAHAAPLQSAPREPGAARPDWLARTIEAEIIPRLMLAHQTGHADLTTPRGERVRPGPTEVAELVQIVLANDGARPREYVQTLRAEGVALEVLYLELLAPAARRLGAMWEDDLCDFTQVTLGLWRLQQVVYDMSPSFHASHVRSPHRRRAMLVPVPGSQHTFGILMVAEFFRRSGWDVWGEPTASGVELVHTARSEWFDMIGLSLGTEVHVSRVASVILALRKASMNPGVVVMIGGPVVSLRPELVALVGADATAADAAQAVSRAESLTPTQERSC